MRLFVVLLWALLAAGAAGAQGWPERPVRLVIPYPVGGGIDTLGRQLAARLGERWGKPVRVENRPGGNTIPGTDLVAKAAPDGLTVLLTTDASISINPLLFAHLPYDAERDFIPVTQLVTLHQLLVAHAGAPFDDLAGLVAAAKARPGELAYASFGAGSQPHLAAALLEHQAGIKLLHVPYKGPSLALPAVVAGEVPLTFAGVGVAASLLAAGKLKALGISGAERSPLQPGVRTFAEQGFGGVESRAWFGLFLPAGSPREAVERLAGEARTLLEEPQFRERHLHPRGYEVVASSPAQFAAFLRLDRAAWARAVRISGARAE